MSLRTSSLRSGALVVALALALALFSSTAALAEPSASDKDTARALMGAANKAFADGDYKAALESFRGADAIMRLPTTGLGVMRTEEKLGLLVEARDKALEIGRIAAKPDEAQPDQDARKEAATLASSIEPKIASITVATTEIAAGREVTVSIDGEKLSPEVAKFPRKVNPNVSHKVLVTAPGYDDGSADATLGEGETRTLTVVMKAIPGWKPPKPPGSDVPGQPVGTRSIHPLLWAGLATVGVGVIVGASTGIYSLTKSKGCKTKNTCPEAAAAVADVGFGVAGVGAVLSFIAIPLSLQVSTPSKSASITPFIGLGSAGVLGSF